MPVPQGVLYNLAFELSQSMNFKLIIILPVAALAKETIVIDEVFNA